MSEKSKHAKGSFLMLYLTRAGHGLDPSMDWIGLDWVALSGGMTVVPIYIVFVAALLMLFLSNNGF